MKNSKGFTLLEVIIVVAIIGIMSAIAIPSLMGRAPNAKLKSAARDLYTNMQKAKGAAVKTNTTVAMNFTAGVGTPCEGGRYVFTDGNGDIVADVTVDKGICISTPTSFPSGFNADGTATAMGRVEITHISVSRTYELTQTIAGAMSLK